MNEDMPSAPCERNGEAAPEAGDIREVTNGVYTRESSTSLSPSLWKNREEPAFELKFQLSRELARQVAEWAEQNLNLDPHADPELDYAYRVHGLYFDTPGLDVFHRTPGYKKKKYRLRRYGSAPLIFLEQKRKSAGRVAKRRIQVEEMELDRLREVHTDLEWAGNWFHRRISVRNLQPSCCISYQRQAYFGQCAEGPLRLTLDRNLCSQLADRWTVEEVVGGMPMLTDKVLLELKFRKHLPSLFKILMQDLSLTPGSLSKYRLAIQTLGRAAVVEGAIDE